MEQKKVRPGEAKIQYMDGDTHRILRGKIVGKDDWGIYVLRDDGKISLSWDTILRIDERSINCQDCGAIATWSMNDNAYFCFTCYKAVEI